MLDPAGLISPKFVSMPSQSAGGRGTPGKMRFVAIATIIRAVSDIRKCLGEAAANVRTAIRPNQTVPGKSIPADVIGFPQLMIPSGGGTLTSKASGPRQY